MAQKITRRKFIQTTSVITAGVMFGGFRLINKFDVIVKNGTVYDGTGSAPFAADLGISGGKIKAVGDLSGSSADLILDAAGKAVSPGFIDIHTHTDTELLISGTGDSKIYQGVTLEVGGNCGYSPFPLKSEEAEKIENDYTESLGEPHWKRIEGFYEALESKGVSFNYASFTGHGNLRAYAVGRNDVPPTPDQLKLMAKLVEESMKNGSLGMSTGLEYSPGSYAKTAELIELNKTVAKFGGVYATHMRNEDDTVEEAIEEALEVCRKAEVSLQISHLKAAYEKNWHKVDSMLAMISEAAGQGLPVKADRYPYTAYGTGLATFLPLWSRQGTSKDVVERLKDDKQIAEIKKYLHKKAEKVGSWDRVIISSCSLKENKKFEGLSVTECCELTSEDPFEFIRNILIEEDADVGMVVFAMSDENLRTILTHPLVMVGSDGSAVKPEGKLGHGKPHPRYYGTFPRVLGRFSRDQNFFDLQTAINKMTAMPADKLGLNDRGRIKKGAYADIVIFDPDTIIDNATFAEPHQLATGIEHLLVNGVHTINKGKHTGALAGNMVRHSV